MGSHSLKDLLSDSPITPATDVTKNPQTPEALRQAIKSPELETWFKAEALQRLNGTPTGIDKTALKDHLEKPNRYPDGSLSPIQLHELLQMSQLCPTAKDIQERAKQGTELLKNNKISNELGTAARGVPGGGASSRAAKWVRKNPELAQKINLTETTPRPLYHVAGKTLLQLTLDHSQHIARKLGRVFPNLVMTSSENVTEVLQTVRADWQSWTAAELENTFFFNQIVLPRQWLSDQTLVQDQLYPAGHGDYPYLLAKYKIISALKKVGIKYLVFSNADEWLWQADPVMISIADEFFKKGHHMLIMGTQNTNNQFGGGFVKFNDGRQSLIETPRLPWDIVKSGHAPIALNTTFYLIDVDYLAEHEEALLHVKKSLVVKEVPGRAPHSTEQIIGVDSWAGDVFAEILNPAFIAWPRLNFLGIKDGSFICGTEVQEALGGRSYSDYMLETVSAFPQVMSDLIEGKAEVCERLFRQGYSYLPQHP